MIMLFSLHIVLPNRAKGEGIPFYRTTVSEGMKMANQENKLLFVTFTASWCMPCQWMDEHTFQDFNLTRYAQANFVSIRLDVDEMTGFQEKETYGINTLPSFLVFNASGQLILRIEKTVSAQQLLHLLQEVNTEANRYGGTASGLSGTPSSSMAHLEKKPLITSPVRNTDTSTNEPTPPQAQAISRNNWNMPPTTPSVSQVVTKREGRGNRYGVHVALFSNYDNAIPFVTRLESRIQEKVDIIVNNQDYQKTIYRVVVGQFQYPAEAKKLREELLRKGYEAEIKELSTL